MAEERRICRMQHIIITVLLVLLIVPSAIAGNTIDQSNYDRAVGRAISQNELNVGVIFCDNAHLVQSNYQTAIGSGIRQDSENLAIMLCVDCGVHIDQPRIPDYKSLKDKVYLESSSTFGSEADVVINEVFLGNSRQWVEIYNKGNSTEDLRDWWLASGTGKVVARIPQDIIYGKSVMDPGDFLVVKTGKLDNGGDDLILHDPEEDQMDSVVYPNAGPHQGLSYACIPDGSRSLDWRQPTMGYPNLLTQTLNLLPMEGPSKPSTEATLQNSQALVISGMPMPLETLPVYK
jgi:hypothetical protein